MITLTESWRPIPGWEGVYVASDQGRIKSLERTVLRAGRPMRVSEQILTPSGHHSGYARVNLTGDGHRHHRAVHEVIATTFHGPRPPGMEIRHLNGQQADNRAENLAYGTSSENARDTVDHGNHQLRNRTHCPLGHELVAPNLVSAEAKRGHRKCRACNTARAYAYRNKLDADALRALADDRYREYMAVTP